MFNPSISGNQPGNFNFIAAFATFQPNPESTGTPCHEEGPRGEWDTLSLSHEACESMHREPEEHHHHHPQPNVNRFKGLDREIAALEQQLSQYESAGNQEDIVATEQLIARDRAMQIASLQGADVEA